MTKEHKHECKEHKQECKCDKEQKEYKEMVQRLQAELENYRKRVERDQKQFCDYATKSLIETVLPTLDNFDLAMKNKDDKEFHKAIEMVHNELHNILKNQGLERISEKTFNPELHQPILQVESEKPKGTILEEIQPGYKFKGKILRHAKVKISGGK